MIHEARFSLPLAPSKVATFIVDVTRVQEYFPGAIEGGTFADGEAIWIRASTGITMIERITDEQQPRTVTVRVTATSVKTAPPTRAELAGAPLMRFTEDWVLEETADGCTVHKVWRDLERFGVMRWLPAAWLIRRSARNDQPKLIAAWSAHA